MTLSQYDPLGNLIARTNRIASVVDNYEFNARGQMIRHTLPENGSGSRRVDEFTYYDAGPQRGYLQSRIVDAANFRITTTYEYDAVGNRVREIDPRGNDTLYTVNALNQVVRETSREVTTGSGVRYAKDFFFDANNNLVRADVPNIDASGVVQSNASFTTTYDYEILNHPVRMAQEVEAGRNIVTEYAYDGKRNRTLTRFGEATVGRQTNNVVLVQYDERDLRFREVRAPGSAGQSTTQFDYDANRNRTRILHGLEESHTCRP